MQVKDPTHKTKLLLSGPSFKTSLLVLVKYDRLHRKKDHVNPSPAETGYALSLQIV